MSENLTFSHTLSLIPLFLESLKVRYINQIDISKMLFVLCPVFQELKSLCVLRMLRLFALFRDRVFFWFKFVRFGGWLVCLLDCS